MTNRFLFNRILLLIILCLAPTCAFAAQAGEVDVVIGVSQNLEDKAVEWKRLKLKDPVMGESIVRTLKDSRLKLSLIDGSIMLLTESSKAKVESVEKEGKSFFRMFSGKIRAVVKKVVSPKSSFEIKTPTAIVGVKGTNFAVILSKDMTEVITFDGVVSVSNVLEEVGGEVLVKANYYTKVTRYAPPSEPVELSEEELSKLISRNGLSSEDLDDYDETKDDKKDDDVELPDIEGTNESDVEEPDDPFDGAEGFESFDFEHEVVEEPEIEDEATPIQEPPTPPDYE
ncbi:FecR domain-containing protein [Thermodesulfobacteriota bacterium]